ncbi:unnamed protein product [Arctia plantaginis]|uniref:Uncharacterized protein n=1 Tax=Arctia plantaginis TaxID=874455 RepID=A0A8S0YQT7_ARCPL|nr:unnamed protein product [Arctia plantaginis]
MPERAREIAFQIQAQRLRTRRAPIRNRASRLTHRRPRPAPLLAELVNSLTPTQLCDAAARALTPTSSALVTSRYCKGEDAEDTFTGLKVLKHSYGELLNKELDLKSMKRMPVT